MPENGWSVQWRKGCDYNNQDESTSTGKSVYSTNDPTSQEFGL